MSDVQDLTDGRVPCEVYSRIVGYLRPVQNWHVGKQQEYKERRMFVLPEPGDPPPADRATIQLAE